MNGKLVMEEIKSTDMEASSLILSLYDIIKSSMHTYKESKDQNDNIISRIPEIRIKLDEIIEKHCLMK